MSDRTRPRGLVLSACFAAALGVAGTKTPQLVNTLDNSRSELEKFFATLATVRSPEAVDALPVVMVGEGLSSVQGEELPVPLSGDMGRAQQVASERCVDEGGMSACLLQLAVALRFRRD